MKMAGLEKFLIRSAPRVYILRKFEAKKVLANLGLPPDSVCLEIGCGQGAGTLLINRYLGCKRVIGVDIDPDMIESAKKYLSRPPGWAKDIRTDNIELLCQDAAELAFPDDYFDAAFLFGVLDHIKDWPRVIREVFRVLKGDGVFSFEEFLLKKSAEKRLGHVSITEQEIVEVLTAAGFEIRSLEITKRIPRCFIKAVKNS